MIISAIKIILIWFFDLKMRIKFNRKIRKIYFSLSEKAKLPPGLVADHKKIWADIGSSTNPNWLKTYASINGIANPCYITEFHYYAIVEPKLNNRSLSEAYCDKNGYHRLIDNMLLSEIYLRNIDGIYYNQRYEQVSPGSEIEQIKHEYKKVIVKKALETGGGRNVLLFKSVNKKWMDNDGNELTKAFLDKYFNKDYIVQEYIEQHPFYKQFNESSVNTVRVFTYRSVKTNAIIPVQVVLRIGKPGAVVDNQASGGIAIGVNDKGLLNPFAVNKTGEKFFEFNSISFQNTAPLFKFDEIVDIAKILAKQFYYHRLLGFDFSVDKQGMVRLIEVNNKNNEINFYQMTNGPLFASFTAEIIEYCRKRKKTFSFDFEI